MGKCDGDNSVNGNAAFNRGRDFRYERVGLTGTSRGLNEAAARRWSESRGHR